MNSIIPPWAEVDSRELYESLFNFPLHEAELIVNDGKTTPLNHEQSSIDTSQAQNLAQS